MKHQAAKVSLPGEVEEQPTLHVHHPIMVLEVEVHKQKRNRHVDPLHKHDHDHLELGLARHIQELEPSCAEQYDMLE